MSYCITTIGLYEVILHLIVPLVCRYVIGEEQVLDFQAIQLMMITFYFHISDTDQLSF